MNKGWVDFEDDKIVGIEVIRENSFFDHLYCELKFVSIRFTLTLYPSPLLHGPYFEST